MPLLLCFLPCSSTAHFAPRVRFRGRSSSPGHPEPLHLDTQSPSLRPSLNRNAGRWLRVVDGGISRACTSLAPSNGTFVQGEPRGLACIACFSRHNCEYPSGYLVAQMLNTWSSRSVLWAEENLRPVISTPLSLAPWSKLALGDASLASPRVRVRVACVGRMSALEWVVPSMTTPHPQTLLFSSSLPILAPYLISPLSANVSETPLFGGRSVSSTSAAGFRRNPTPPQLVTWA